MLQTTTSGPATRVGIVLGLLTIFGPISMDLYLPSRPSLADGLGVTASAS